MKLILVRHGIAVDVGTNGIKKDFDRTLSPEGKKKTRLAAKGLAAIQCRPQKIFSSPRVRARQTAGILASVLLPKSKQELGVCPALEMDAKFPAFVKWLKQQSSLNTIMAVGHMPHLTYLTSFLITKSGKLDVEYKKAAACLISFDHGIEAGKGRIDWLIQPRELRILGSR